LQLNLDAVWTVIFGVPASKPVSVIAKEKLKTELCPDAALVLLALIRHMLNQVGISQELLPCSTGSNQTYVNSGRYQLTNAALVLVALNKQKVLWWCNG
jgi:hypothetical protein